MCALMLQTGAPGFAQRAATLWSGLGNLRVAARGNLSQFLLKAGRPANCNLIDTAARAKPKVEPGIVPRKVASTIPDRIEGLSPAEIDLDARADGVAIGSCAAKAKSHPVVRIYRIVLEQERLPCDRQNSEANLAVVVPVGCGTATVGVGRHCGELKRDRELPVLTAEHRDRLEVVRRLGIYMAIG